jgi:hypothetical protein
MIKKLIALALLGTLLLPSAALAQGTLLPNTDITGMECREIYDNYENIVHSFFRDQETYSGDDWDSLRAEYLACAIKTGKLRLWMLPYFVQYIANFFIGVSGVISMLFVVLGGFWYMTGGITDGKDKGKKTIFYALVGLVITLLAWIIVNVIQVQVTG